MSSLTAQNRLARTNADLNQSLTRLSTGLRINSGKDDPAGLIASEALRSDITSINKALTNTQRATQIIATADSALGQVSSLLNDIRGLVTEAANTGALSSDEIAANQLQVDSSLEAINRISQTTTFQGRKLLDGSLDFQTNASSVASLKDIRIDQANLGSTGSVSVDVVISAKAEKAEIVAATSGFTTKANATVNSGINFGTATQVINGENIAIVGEGLLSINIVDNLGVASQPGTASFDSATGALTITGNFTATAAAASAGPPPVAAVIGKDASALAIQTAIAALSGFTATGATAAGTSAAATAGTVSASAERLVISAVNKGAEYNNVKVQFKVGTTNEANYDTTQKILTVTVNGPSQTGAAVKAAIDAAKVDGATPASPAFSATVLANTEFRALGAQLNSTGVKLELDTKNTGGEVLKDKLVFKLNGTDGAETLNFQAGSSIDQIAKAVNLLSDSTGVSSTVTDAAGLNFNSVGYGSKATIALEVISEGAAGTFGASLNKTRVFGKDISATINGIDANGSGNRLSINTSALGVSLTVAEGSNVNFSFNISGGGAKFQLGPVVNSSQQARLGIGSVSTGSLGGVNGRLYELGSGQGKALATDANGAAKIVDEVITRVTSLRGRLGAFQRTNLESNSVSLNDTLSNLNEAQSTIRDADFAKESANLTRAQILTQSGTSVLGIANQSSQNVLSLLR